MAEKKNPDYSASAVMLTNPPQVEECVLAQRVRIAKLATLEEQAQALIPESLKTEITNLQREISVEDKGIRGFIDTFGSFQDVELGLYGVKQKRESIAYKPELVRQYAPSKVASFVIIESVDSKGLDALLKAGQITPEVARQCGEVKESFAYIIK